MVMHFASFLLAPGARESVRRSPIRSGMTVGQVGVTVGFMRLPVAAGNDWWVVMFGCFAMLGCLFRHARLRPGISYDCDCPINVFLVTGNLWKQFLQD